MEGGGMGVSNFRGKPFVFFNMYIVLPLMDGCVGFMSLIVDFVHNKPW